jgi:hypothetical protein
MFGGRIAFVDDYDLHVAHFLVQGCDVWLNNPRKPLEASGTSGMKASLNGVPHLSIGDGWWAEGYTGDNGWLIDTPTPATRRAGRAWTSRPSTTCSSATRPDLLRPRRHGIPAAGSFVRRRSDSVMPRASAPAGWSRSTPSRCTARCAREQEAVGVTR